MQLYSRILVNLLVKLTRILVILVDLLVKPNWKEPQGQRGGAMGPGLQGMDRCLAGGDSMTMWGSAFADLGGTDYETIHETKETEEEKKRLPLYDFHRFSPTFLG